MARGICDFKTYVPEQYYAGLLAESWETVDLLTTTVGDLLTADSSMNFGRINNPVLESPGDESRNAANDAELRETLVAFDKYYLEQHYCIPIFPLVGYTRWQPYFRGYSGEELQYTVDKIFARCWIDQSLKSSMGYQN